MTNALEWEETVGRSWAKMHLRTDRSFAPLTRRMLGLLEAIPGNAILDIGSGAGELSLALARARPGAAVVGVDVSPDLIAAAQARGAGRGNARFVLADAARWREEGFAPDLLVSRHGVMFFDDPVVAFAYLHAISAPGARMLFSCFRTAAENPWASGVAKLLPQGDPAAAAAPQEAGQGPGPFAFADPEHVRSILSQAGWRDVAVEPFDFPWIAGVGSDPVADAAAYLSRIGPAAAAMRQLEGDERAAFEERLLAWLEAHREGERVAFSAAAWLVTAHYG